MSMPQQLFVPCDFITMQAFTAALTELNLTAAQLLASGDVLARLLRYHVVPSGALTAAAIPLGNNSLATLA